jgi:hypothetical protein
LPSFLLGAFLFLNTTIDVTNTTLGTGIELTAKEVLMTLHIIFKGKMLKSIFTKEILQKKIKINKIKH